MSQSRWVNSRSLSIALVVLGGPLVPIGILTMLSTFTMDLSGAVTSGRGVMVVIGLLMTLAGALFVLARKGVIVDGETKMVTFWWGLWSPMRQRNRDVSTYRRIGVYPQLRRSKSEHGPDDYTVYVVSLLGPKDQVEALLTRSAKPVILYEAETSAQALMIAEQVSAVLGLPFEEMLSV